LNETPGGLKKITQGIAAADRGELFDHDQVMQEMENRIQQAKNHLKDASGYVFYNTSKWTLNQLSKTATNNQQILLANVEEYLNGYSANVKEIIAKFNLKAQVRHMASKDVLLIQ
jgi:type I restriction-modification system DNA methylase subunit